MIGGPHQVSYPDGKIDSPSALSRQEPVWLAGTAGDISHIPAGCAAVLLSGSGHTMDGQAHTPDRVLHAAAPRLHPGAECWSHSHAVLQTEVDSEVYACCTLLAMAGASRFLACLAADGHLLLSVSQSDAQLGVWPSCQKQTGPVSPPLKVQAAARGLQSSYLHHRCHIYNSD